MVGVRYFVLLRSKIILLESSISYYKFFLDPNIKNIVLYIWYR